jgi:hypothetical protein
MTPSRLAVSCTLAVAWMMGLAGSGPRAAETPRVRQFRTQRVGDTTFFQVIFKPPADMENIAISPESETLMRQPRLVPQDERAFAVYHRLNIPTGAGGPGGQLKLDYIAPSGKDEKKEEKKPQKKLDKKEERPAAPVEIMPPAQPLEFVGKLHGEGKVRLLLLYPIAAPAPKAPRANALLGLDWLKAGKQKWAEVPVELDPAKAVKVAVPPQAARRRQGEAALSANDLEGLWASAQAGEFARLEALTHDFGFYGFAREATARKYGVAAPPLPKPAGSPAPKVDAQLYELTTGAAAIAESLQLQRMLQPDSRDRGKRTIDIAKVPGIDIAEHPWEKMMGGKKRAPDPLARLVPFDNYYVRFRSLSKFLEFAELIDQWGGHIVQTVDVANHDYSIRSRYQKQLCLRNTGLGKVLGPALVRSLALTGSDAYLREGSDVTVVFEVTDRKLFLAAVEPFIEEARKEFGTRLKESRADYRGTTIESFVTPLREVSLHRALVGDFVLYSNSPAGLRCLDAFAGRTKPLADSLDFQYMRTLFPPGDAAEDSFAFLSDPFIRRQVGPAVKIKEKRRLEALTSLHMLSNGALFTAWETGKLPSEQKALLSASTLKLEEIYAPEGKDITWDAERQVAVSEAYNTLQFATPLIELPISKITPREQQEYDQFRQDYLKQWREYFDPIGMRLKLTDRQVKLEVVILPLVQSTAYNEVRRWTGGGTFRFDPSRISPKTLFQLKTHISTDLQERNEAWDVLSLLGGKVRPLDFLGDWFLVRLDSNDALDGLAGALMQDVLGEGEKINEKEATRQFFQVPLTLGVSIRNPLVFAPALAAIRTAIMTSLPGALTWEPMPAYKGVSMVEVKATPNGEVIKFFNEIMPDKDDKPGKEPFTPRLFYALIDGGWYLSVTDAALRSLIDESEAMKEAKKRPRSEMVDANVSLHLAPGAAGPKLRALLSFYLEMASHEQAVANLPAWYAFYHGGLLDGAANAEAKADVVRRYLGDVPVSPEGAPFTYEARTDEVVNARHGSLRRPNRHQGVAATSPLGFLLDHLRSVRADLRFHEDGIFTTLTIDRKPKAAARP